MRSEGTKKDITSDHEPAFVETKRYPGRDYFIPAASTRNRGPPSLTKPPYQTSRTLRYISCLRAGTDFCALFLSNRYARNKVGLFDSRLTIQTEYVNNPYSHSPNSSLTHGTSPDGFRDLTSAAFLGWATPSAPPPSSFCSTKQATQSTTPS